MTFTNNGLTSIKFRFYGKTGSGGDRSDMGVDNFSILQTSPLSIDGSSEQPNIVLNAGTETEGESLALSPNPVASDLLVSYFAEKEQTSKISVIDQTGRVVLSKTTNTFEGRNSYQLDVTSLPPGLYILSVEGEQSRKVERFVVLR